MLSHDFCAQICTANSSRCRYRPKRTPYVRTCVPVRSKHARVSRSGCALSVHCTVHSSSAQAPRCALRKEPAYGRAEGRADARGGRVARIRARTAVAVRPTTARADALDVVSTPRSRARAMGPSSCSRTLAMRSVSVGQRPPTETAARTRRAQAARARPEQQSETPQKDRPIF